MARLYHGSCLCEAVRFRAEGPISDVVACHCTQCRKQSGHHYAAANVADDRLMLDGGENLSWFQSSPDARRGFCRICGSALFWKNKKNDFTAILAGSFDGETGLKIEKHIFCADKGDYYDISDGVPQTP